MQQTTTHLSQKHKLIVENTTDAYELVSDLIEVATGSNEDLSIAYGIQHILNITLRSLVSASSCKIYY